VKNAEQRDHPLLLFTSELFLQEIDGLQHLSAEFAALNLLYRLRACYGKDGHSGF